MKTKFKRIGKQSLSIVLAVMMMVSTMLVGAITSNAATEATATVYTTLSSISDFSSYINSDGSLKSGYTLKANSQYGGEGDGAKIWKQVDFTKYDKTIGSKVVYTANVRYYSDWGGINTLQFQIYSGTTQNKSVAIINNTWTNISTIQNKYYNGSSWVTPTWDDTTKHNVTANFSNATVKLGDTTLTSGVAVTVDNDTDYTLTVTPAQGYSLTSVKFGSEEKGTSGTYTYNSSSATTINITTVKNADPSGWQIRNKFTGEWKDIDFVSASGSVISVDCYLEKTDTALEFLIHSSSTWYKTNSSTRITETDNTRNNGPENTGDYKNNLFINVSKTGTYTFKFDTSNKNLTVIYPKVKYHDINVVTDNATVAINNNIIASGNSAKVAENTSYTLAVTPNDGYYITKVTVGGDEKFAVSSVTDDNYATAKKEVTFSDLTMGTEDVDVKVETAKIVKPTVTLTADNITDVYFGTTVNLTPSYEFDASTGVTFTSAGYTVEASVEDSTVVEDNKFTVPTSLGEDNDTVHYTITYTVTLSNGESSKAVVEFTAKDTEKEALVTPVLGGTLNVGVKDTVALYVTNESSFDDNVVFTLYKVGQETAITTLKKGDKYTANATMLGAGSHQFYVVASLADSDYKDSTSEKITVNVYETVDVSVEADANGTAYISSYVAVSGAQTSTSLTSATVRKGSEVTFTATPKSGYSVASWDGEESSDTTKTIFVSDATTVNVAFKEKPTANLAVVGKTLTFDTSSKTKPQYSDGLAFENNVAVMQVMGNSNWFGFVDSDGKYYNVASNTQVTSGNSYTVNVADKAPASGCVSWISSSVGTYYKLTITEFKPGVSLTYKLNTITPWKIYGDSTNFAGWGTGNIPVDLPITLSYDGGDKYYYPVTLKAGDTAFFGFHFGNYYRMPAGTDKELPAYENQMYANSDDYKCSNTSLRKAFYIKAAVDGVYKICVNTKTTSIWYEAPVSDPVSVELNADLVDGGAAYISSYTDNDTGNIVTNTDETVQSVNAKPGTSVTFKAKSVDGYFPKWKFGGKFATGDTYTLDASSVTGTTVTVYLTYEKIENHSITITSGKGGSVTYAYDSTSGSVEEGKTSSAITVASNKTITLTATPDIINYVFDGWQFSDDSNVVFVSGDSASTSITINVTGDVDITASYEENPGTLSSWKFMLSDSDQGLSQDTTGKYKTDYSVYENNGTYSVTFPVSAISSNNTQYLSFSTSGTNSGLVPNNNTFKVVVDDNFKNYVKDAKNKDWGGNYFPQVQFQNTDDITNIKVTYNPSTQTYTINGTYFVAPANSHKVYATMGSQVGHKFGTTTISLLSGNKPIKTNVKDFYNLYVVNDKEQITVSCSVSKDQADLGYYVYAFVVNGAKVDVVDNGNNVYQTASPITVTENLEITPIYYNKVIEADGNYITIYTNAPESLQTSWGNSIAIYSWYNNNKAYMDGAYPGQLMMRDAQGRFVAKVAKYAYTNVGGKFTCDKTSQVLGITNNSYYEYQDVHQKFLNKDQSDNNQTYDYDDFEKLTGMGYDTVEFDVKYYADKTESNQKLLVNNDTNNKSMAGTTIISKTATDYEDLTNIDGKLVSILGYTNETAKNKNHTGLNTAEPLQIISVGNQSMRIGTINNKWSTIWYVYASNGKYVTQGLPSDFIPRGSVDDEGNFTEGKLSEQTTAYQAIVNAGLQYNSAKISYEIRMGASTSVDPDNTGKRIDGRWYYARSVDQVDVKLGIIYRNNDSDAWTVDKASDDSEITGKVTGGTSSFDYTDSVGSSYTNLASASVERNTVITINATNGTQYKFIGWATPKYDADGKVTGYTPLNLTDLNATYTVSTNTELYAMYEPYATGSVTITHSKYTGADSHNGLGLFYVTAKEVDANGNNISNQAVATQSDAGSVTLENIVNRNDDSCIEVTLYTQSYAKSHFLNFYYPSVKNGVSTLTKEPNGDYYDKECPADARATQTFRVKVSDLFVNDKQTVMALNYYSDLKLPEVESNITFNYNPYNTAPNPNPAADKGNGKTTFTLTITKNGYTDPVFTTTGDLSSLTLKANGNIKSIIEDYVANAANGTDYTISIKLNPVEDNHCAVGKSYYQQNDSGSYTYKEIGTTVDITTVDIKLSDIYDIPDNKFYTNTINLYTDFTADVFNYNVTFKYLGYESREYYNNNGFTQDEIPKADIKNNWWRTYTVSGTFYGTDIDKYFDNKDGQYKIKESFLLKVAPYEDNFVQSITWDLKNVDYSVSKDVLSVTATVPAKYSNGFVTVTADLGDGKPKQSYSVNYASLVTADNLIGTSTESNENSESEYLIVAPETNANGEKFSYWTIQTDDSNGIEVAKCYSNEFNFLAYDNYLITACYGKDDVDDSKLSVSATMQFLEYSRNQYDSGKDKVYADFAVSYNYNGKKLCADINNDVVCGVVFVVNSKYSSAADATDKFTVDESELLEKVKALNSGSLSDKTMDDAKVYNYKLNKKNLDNKNRLEYSWNVNNTENNQNLTILAYSYIYNATTDEYSVSAPQEFKFFNVGNKTYKVKQ